VRAVLHEADEAVERALFARRAASMAGAAAVPSLEAVLLAAHEDPRDGQRGRRRAWTGLALAAACLLIVVRRPHEMAPPSASPEPDADVVAENAGFCSVETGGACRLESVATRRPAVVVVHARGAGVCAPMSFTSSSALTCEDDEPAATAVP